MAKPPKAATVKTTERTVTIPKQALERIAILQAQIKDFEDQRTTILETVLETLGITGDVEFVRAKGNQFTVRVPAKA